MVRTDKAAGVRLVTDADPIPDPVDVRVTGHGTIYLFDPLTARARDWIAENVSDESSWFAGALAVEHRYAADLAAGMVCDGLSLR